MKKLFFCVSLLFLFVANVFAQQTDGKLHNAILKEILAKKNLSEIAKNEALFKSELSKSLHGEVSNTYSQKAISLDMTQSLQAFNAAGINLSNFTLSQAKKGTQYLLSKGKISATLSNEINLIFEKIYSTPSSISSVLNDVNKLKTIQLTQQDKYYADTFVDIFQSSYAFWKGNDDNGIIGKFTWKNLVTVAADSVCGAIGATIGGVGAPILGGYCSGMWVFINIPIFKE